MKYQQNPLDTFGIMPRPRKIREIIKNVSKVELWFLYTILFLNVLYHKIRSQQKLCYIQENLINVDGGGGGWGEGERLIKKVNEVELLFLYTALSLSVLYRFFQQNPLNTFGVMLRTKV